MVLFFTNLMLDFVQITRVTLILTPRRKYCYYPLGSGVLRLPLV